MRAEPTSWAALRFALRRLRRGWASGQLRVLVAALAIAAAAVTAVGQFSDRVERAVEDSSGDALGADAVLPGRDPPPADLVAEFRCAGLRQSLLIEFPSVVLYGEQTQLVSVKAVQAGYPLRGSLTLSQDLYGVARPAHGAPPRGQVWVDPRLWTLLALRSGATLRLGSSTFAVTALIAGEPGRGGAFGELAPELIMNADDLAATQLLGPGSRVQYTLQLVGAPPLIARAAALAKAARQRFLTPRDARPELKESMQRARDFLSLAVLATLLLAAAAIALSARQQAMRLRDEIALLKCLGAQRGFIGRTLLWQLLLLALLGGGAGAALGAAIQLAGAAVAAPALGVVLPPTSFWPVPTALALVLLLTLGFALPPLLDAVAVPPLRVFQRGVVAGRSALWSLLAAALAVVLLLRIEAGSTKLAALMLGGTAITVALLGLAAFGLMYALKPLQARAGVAWRFGLGNIVRRRGASVAQIVALGVALLALLLLTVVRQDLLSSWQQRLPPKTPNQFLINIQPAQIAPLRAFFAARGVVVPELWPMVRGRLVALDGQPVDADRYSDPETRRWINREFNLSWTERFGDDNTLLQGSWWPPATRGQPWLSVEQYAVERLGLKLGDTLTLDIAGRRVTLTVHDVRKVRWDSFRPNFFLVTPPGVLDDLNAVQWITSFYLPPGDRGLLRDLARQFPNVTAIDLQAAMDEIRRLIDRIVHALELILLFALAAGLIVVLAVMEGAREERARETGVLRALGASSRVIVQGLIAEYATLGLLAGAVASLAAQGLAWQLAAQVFHIGYGPRPLLWLIGALGGALLVGFTGWLSLRSTLNTPPRIVLAADA